MGHFPQRLLFQEILGPLESSRDFQGQKFLFCCLRQNNSITVAAFFKINYLFIFIFGCTGSSLLHTGFLQLRQAGATVRGGAQASHCSGFSRCGARAPDMRASVVAAHRLSSCGSRALERRLSSYGTQAQLLHSMWDLPGPGLEPVSPALAGGFLTTAPPGKPGCFLKAFILILRSFHQGFCSQTPRSPHFTEENQQYRPRQLKTILQNLHKNWAVKKVVSENTREQGSLVTYSFGTVVSDLSHVQVTAKQKLLL